MTNFVFNVSKGKARHYAELPGANDALVLVLLESSGLESDPELADRTTLADILAGTSNEQAALGRKTVTDVTVTTDSVANRVDADFPDPSYASASGNPVGALIVCYDPDTGTGTDANLIPMTKHDCLFTPDGSDVIVELSSSGFYRAQ